jgi:hypothetical protein
VSDENKVLAQKVNELQDLVYSLQKSVANVNAVALSSTSTAKAFGKPYTAVAVASPATAVAARPVGLDVAQLAVAQLTDPATSVEYFKRWCNMSQPCKHPTAALCNYDPMCTWDISLPPRCTVSFDMQGPPGCVRACDVHCFVDKLSHAHAHAHAHATPCPPPHTHTHTALRERNADQNSCHPIIQIDSGQTQVREDGVGVTASDTTRW